MSKLCVAVLAVLIALIAYIFSGPSSLPSPLLRAAYKGELDVVQRMLPLPQPGGQQMDESFAEHIRREANAQDAWNNTALHWAARSGSPRSVTIVKHLLRAGANLHARNQGGSTALHWACTVAVPDIAQSLISELSSSGLALEVTNTAGETPLHWAVEWLSVGSVTKLLELGANPNQVDLEGNIPLHKTKADCDQNEDCTSIVTLLVKAGSDVMSKNAYKRTPLQYFNQDREQQMEKEKEKKRQGEQQQQQQEEEEEGASSTPPAELHRPAPPSAPLRMTPEQVDQLQEQIEEFQRNLTEAGMVMQQQTS